MSLVCRAIALLLLATAVHSKSKVQLCQTPECLALSALITSNMNQTADPCEDFVGYACGNFHLNTQYDPAIVTWSEYSEFPEMMQSGINMVSEKLRKKVFELLLVNRTVDSDDPDVSSMYRLARTFFRSCASWVYGRTRCTVRDCESSASQSFFNGVLTHLLDTIDQRKVDGSFERALARMVGMLFWPMLEIRPNSMMGNASQTNIVEIRIGQGIRYYTRGMNAQPYMEFFKQLSAASSLSLNNLTADKFEKTMNEIIEIANYDSRRRSERALRRCIGSISDDSKEKFTIEEINAYSACASPNSSFSWSVFFDELLDTKESNNTVIYNDLGGISQVIDIVTYFKERAFWQEDGQLSPHFSFLVVDWLFSFAPYFPQHLAREWQKNGYRSTYMPSLKYNPVGDCIELSKRLLGPIVELMYQKSHHVDSFDEVSELVGLIQNATIRNVREQDWITPKSKEAIVEKIRAQKHVIGFDKISTQQIKEIYGPTIRAFNQGRYLQGSDSFGMMFSLAACAYAGRMKSTLSGDSPSPGSLPPMEGLVVNAFNFMRENQIVFPMGILSPFFYHRSYPAYMNIGGIGVIIGHEIGHGFDETGHELNKKGAYGHFWDNETETEYLRRIECVKSRFSQYELVPGRPHKSESTLGNDIADIMGIQSAFSAMKLLEEREKLLRLPNLPNSLTPERLFFVQAAQAWCTKAEPVTLVSVFGEYPSHSPPHIRIRGMMENSKDFARVFQCKANQTMNPIDKCEFW